MCDGQGERKTFGRGERAHAPPKCPTTQRKKIAMAMEREHFNRRERWVHKQHRLTRDEIEKFEIKSSKLEGTLTTNGNFNAFNHPLFHNLHTHEQ